MTSNKNGVGTNVKKGLAIGSAVVAGIGAIAGAYFLYGTEAGKKKRKQIKGWMLRAKGEVLEKIENIKDITEDQYKAAVTQVMKKYESFKEKYGDDVAALHAELMSYWSQIKKHTGPKKSPKARSTHKTAGVKRSTKSK